MNIKYISLFLTVFFLTACEKTVSRDVLHGETMGTYYKIDVVNRHQGVRELASMRGEIEALLAEINASQSTWHSNSVISLFNEDTAFLRPFPIDDHFVNVMRIAERVFIESKGAFNPALAPLIELWGFDKTRKRGLPEVFEVKEALRTSNFSTIVFDPDAKTIMRTVPGVSLNFSAVAKGYAVDSIARLLLNAGITDFLVDIGGELYAKGKNELKQPWRVAIQMPDYDNFIIQDDPHLLALTFESEIMHLGKHGIATSGDYRNFRMIAGKLYTHILDPRTGEPTDSRVASASVISRSAGFADAWATALMVMGRSGIEYCNNNDMACMILSHTDDDSFEKIASSDWLKFYALDE